MNTLRIAGGRVLDPSQDLDREEDLWIVDGKFAGPDAVDHRDVDETIDARGLLVVPGLVDMHVHFREPGGDADETIASGTRAALESGFTSVASMPDSSPAVDNQASAEFVTLQARRAGNINVWPVGAVTKGRAGEELAEMGGLIEGGAVAFSDSDRPIASADIMRRALEYARMFEKPILSHPEVPELTRHGIMNEGLVSTVLGMPGIPAAAEEIMVERDLRLARWTGGTLHLQNLSCEGSVEALRRAKRTGLLATGEVCPHHFTLTDEALRSFDSNFKVNPPLRTAAAVEALIEGLIDGTIDAIASGHSPRATEQKLMELDAAPFGVIGIETLLAVSAEALVEPGHLSWLGLVAKLSTNPARILGIERGTLKRGQVADVTLIDPDDPWTIDPDRFLSQSRNCPFAGWEVRARAAMVVVAGKVAFRR